MQMVAGPKYCDTVQSSQKQIVPAQIYFQNRTGLKQIVKINFHKKMLFQEKVCFSRT